MLTKSNTNIIYKQNQYLHLKNAHVLLTENRNHRKRDHKNKVLVHFIMKTKPDINLN